MTLAGSLRVDGVGVAISSEGEDLACVAEGVVVPVALPDRERNPEETLQGY